MIYKEEVETVILDSLMDEKASISTSHTGMMKKLDKLCEEFPNDFEYIEGDEIKIYKVSKKCISIHKPHKEYTLSDEEKEKRRARLKSARNMRTKKEV